MLAAIALATACAVTGVAPPPVSARSQHVEAVIPGDVRPEGTWLWPVSGDRAVTRPFEAPETRYSAGHRGVDLLAASGTTVVAPASGVVSFAGTVVDRPVLSITSEGSLVSSIEPVIALVSEGDVVRAGEVVGTVGNGGHCSAQCAHFGVRLFGRYVNPLALLRTLPRAVLLPVTREPVRRGDALPDSSP
jgi:murein DD-endopeptidase MepM/ murein hydrolase activator NlpD